MLEQTKGSAPQTNWNAVQRRMRRKIPFAAAVMLLLSSCAPTAPNSQPADLKTVSQSVQPADSETVSQGYAANPASLQESLSPDPSSSALQTGDRAQFDVFVEGLDQRRSLDLTWSLEEQAAFSACMPEYGSQLNTFSEEELERLTTRRETRAFSVEDARKDVDTFFTLLRTTYGGYDYFGGDGTFYPLRDQALAGLKDSGEMTVTELEELLRGTVEGVILDGHFLIGSHDVIGEERLSMYYVPDLFFQDATGMDQEYVKPTIGPNGAIAYCFSALSHDGGDLPRTAAIPGGQTVNLQWIRAQSFDGWSEAGRIPYERRNADGLPVLICETLDDSEKPQPLLLFMGRSGKEYQTLPAFAVDLRGNWGGNDGYAQQWMEGFTGRWPQAKIAGGVKFSQLCMAARGDYESKRQSDLGVSPGDWGKVIEDGVSLPNDNLVFLLTDNETASSGEDFVSYLRSLNHVVTVGSNTAGCQTFGNVMDFYLPCSGLRVRVGASFFFWDTAANREGSGYLPDLWVNPPDALDAVVRLCDYYGLK